MHRLANLLLVNGPEPLAKLLVEEDNQLAQTILLDISDAFVHAILEFHRGLRILKVPQVGLELGHLAANVALGEYEFIVLVGLLLGCLLVGLLLLDLVADLRAAAGEDGTQQLPLRLLVEGWLEVFIQLHEFLELGLDLADVEVFLHYLNVVFITIAYLQPLPIITITLMEITHPSSPLARLFSQTIQNVTSATPFVKLHNDLVQLHSGGELAQVKGLVSQQQSISNGPLPNQQRDIGRRQHISEQLDYQIADTQQVAAIQKSDQLRMHGKQAEAEQQKGRKVVPLQQPPSIQQPVVHQQSMKDSSSQNKQIVRQSSEESSINMQLTLKTKQTRNLSNTLARQDSLIYSDATLMYSNATGFGAQSHNPTQQLPQRSQSHKSALRQIQDGQQNEISTKMERAVSREVARARQNTDETTSLQQIQANLQSQPKEEEPLFPTEVEEYKSRITRVRQIKEKKKKQLENELNRVTREIDELARKESEAQVVKSSDFESRVKIADNAVAQVKASKLVRGLQKEKKARHQAHLDELQLIDRNINHYMEELMKERFKNQEKTKQKKKLEIIERMKHQEMRKIEDQKQKELNIKFVAKLKGSSSRPHIQQQVTPTKYQLKNPVSDKRYEIPAVKQRSPTRVSEQGGQDSQITPELSRKKAMLKKVRNISFKKERQDAYQQILM